MSVIIKMLKDLEQRQQPGAETPPKQPKGEFVQPQIQYQSVVKSRLPLVRLIIVALLIPLLWFGVSMFRQLDHQMAIAPMAVNTVAEPKENPLVVNEATVPNMANESTEIKALVTASAPESALANIQDNSVATNESMSTTNVIANAEIETEPKTASQQSKPEKMTVVQSTLPKMKPIASDTRGVVSTSTTNQTASTPVNTPKVKKEPADMTVQEVVLSKKQMAQLQYRKAIEAEQAQRLDDAAGYYLEAIILQPSLHKARKQLVEIYYIQNNVTTATRLLESGMSMFPQQWEFYLILSRIQTQTKAYDQALSTLAMIPDNSPWARDKWIAQTDLAQNANNFVLAEDAYRNLLVSESTQSRWWMGLGYALDSQKKYSQAAQAYRSALSYEGLSTSAMTFIEKRLDQLGENR
ncbi:tetratricopeptide repeat protein [Shewanella sp. A14]